MYKIAAGTQDRKNKLAYINAFIEDHESFFPYFHNVKTDRVFDEGCLDSLEALQALDHGLDELLGYSPVWKDDVYLTESKDDILICFVKAILAYHAFNETQPDFRNSTFKGVSKCRKKKIN